MRTLKDPKSSNPNLGLDLKQLPALPDINKQIEYVQHIRKDVIPNVKPLRREMVMIFAIEQSLLAAKRYEQSKDKNESEIECQKILGFYNIQLTTIRIEVLKAILSKADQGFTISEICSVIPKRRAISKPAVTAAIDLFKRRGIVFKEQHSISKKGPGRPQEKFRYDKHSLTI